MNIENFGFSENFRLLVRPAPLEGESWGGFLMRLASANHLAGLGTLARLMGRTSQELLVSPPDIILGALGIAWEAGAQELPMDRPAPVHRVNLPSAGRTRRSRVCPHCLASDDVVHLRAAWEMPMTVVCKVHHVMLLDRCQACSRTLDLFRSSVDQCPCGASFKLQQSIPTTGWVAQLATVFEEAHINEPMSTFGTAQPMAQEAARTCYWLGILCSPDRRKGKGRVIDREAFLASATLNALAPVLINWPNALIPLVQGECDPTRWDGYKSFSERLCVTKFAAMREVIACLKVRVSRSERPWSAVNRRALTRHEQASFGIKDLMTATKHSYTALVACIDRGRLPGVTYVTNPVSGQKVFNVPAATYWAIVDAFNRSSDVRGAAVEFGCAEGAIRGLVHSKCLRHAPFLPSGFKYRLDPAELARFAERLFSLSTYKRNAPSAERVYFSDWVAGGYSTKSSWRWRVLIEAIRSEKIKLYKAVSVPTTLNDLYLRQDERKLAFLGTCP